jgi:hypothetical protein
MWAFVCCLHRPLVQQQRGSGLRGEACILLHETHQPVITGHGLCQLIDRDLCSCERKLPPSEEFEVTFKVLEGDDWDSADTLFDM